MIYPTWEPSVRWCQMYRVQTADFMKLSESPQEWHWIMSSIVQLSFPASMILEHALLPYHSSEDASPAPSRLKFNWHVFKVLKCIFELKCSTKFARFLASLSSFWWFTHQVFPPAGPEFGRGGGSAWQHMDPFILLLVYPTALEEVSNTMTMYTSRIVFYLSKVLGEQSIPAHAPFSLHEWGVHQFWFLILASIQVFTCFYITFALHFP